VNGEVEKKESRIIWETLSETVDKDVTNGYEWEDNDETV